MLELIRGLRRFQALDYEVFGRLLDLCRDRLGTDIVDVTSFKLFALHGGQKLIGIRGNTKHRNC